MILYFRNTSWTTETRQLVQVNRNTVKRCSIIMSRCIRLLSRYIRKSTGTLCSHAQLLCLDVSEIQQEYVKPCSITTSRYYNIVRRNVFYINKSSYTVHWHWKRTLYVLCCFELTNKFSWQWIKVMLRYICINKSRFIVIALGFYWKKSFWWLCC